VDGEPLASRERTRLWLFNKPKGLVTTNCDPEGRATILHRAATEMPRVVTIGRLDINTEGLLLLTNDGGLARVLELPATAGCADIACARMATPTRRSSTAPPRGQHRRHGLWRHRGEARSCAGLEPVADRWPALRARTAR
jgi:hypothetical protein